MEKRVFELKPRRSKRFVIAFATICAAFFVGWTWLWWHQRNQWWMIPNAWALIWTSHSLLFPQGGKLEVSDQGLFLTVTRDLGYLLRWDAIRSVRIHENSNAARRWSVIVEDSLGHVVRVPRKCRATTEILGILRQRLPDSVFQAW